MRTHEVPGQAHGTPLVTPARNSRGPRTPGALQSTAGNAVVSRMITVSRMMTEDEFRQGTSSVIGKRSHSEITKVDDALRAFYALPDAGQAARLFALKDIVRACGDYVTHKGDGGGSRVRGTQQLGVQAQAAQGQLDPEAVFRDLLTEIDQVMSEGKNPEMDLRMPAGEAQKAAQAIPADGFHSMMGDFVQKLGTLREDETLPEETRAVIGELMAVVPLVTKMQYPQGGMPGMRLNDPAAPDPSFTFNVDTQARGGTSFLLGHIAHELTHVAAHQAFGSSPVMELVQSGATDEEVAALAAERKQSLADLKAALAGNPEFDDFQETMLEEKLGYGAQPHKLESYAIGFEKAGKITPEQKKRLIGWGKAAGDASGALVEYDTVLNQMLIYLHMWQTSQDNPFYVRLRAAAQAAYDRRSRARRPATAAATATEGSAE